MLLYNTVILNVFVNTSEKMGNNNKRSQYLVEVNLANHCKNYKKIDLGNYNLSISDDAEIYQGNYCCDLNCIDNTINTPDFKYIGEKMIQIINGKFLTRSYQESQKEVYEYYTVYNIKPNGYGKITYKHGHAFFGKFRHGYFENGILIYNDHCIYNGEFFNGYEYGKCIIKWKCGITCAGKLFRRVESKSKNELEMSFIGKLFFNNQYSNITEYSCFCSFLTNIHELCNLIYSYNLVEILLEFSNHNNFGKSPKIKSIKFT